MKGRPLEALHLTASMRVLRFHLHRPALTVEDAHNLVKELAPWLGTGKATADDLALEEKLKNATGVTPAEVGKQAEDWPVEP
jgi:hypothetical protein